MKRPRRFSHGGSDFSVDDDHEMEAMAKVWAHPEDLHLFPVSLYDCLVSARATMTDNHQVLQDESLLWSGIKLSGMLH